MSLQQNSKPVPTAYSADPGAHHPFYSALQAWRRHATGGNILIGATVLALLAANIPGVRELYSGFWTQSVYLQVGDFNIFSHSGEPMSMLGFINDALMAIFFFSIGLEIKREVLVGELSSIRQALLPIMAAVGGMVVPVVLYLLLASGTDYVGGAAIPMATDIAFSLGILAMLGSRVPVSLKVFLTTLAVVDDIGGIIVIAVFYSTHIEVVLLMWSLLFLALLLGGNLLKIKSKIFYLGVGGVVWFLFLNSGVHPTIAGVLVAFCVPATPIFAPKKYVKDIRTAISNFSRENDDKLESHAMLSKEQIDWLKIIESASDKVVSPLQDLEDSLHPVVNNFIVPLFAFANAGIYLLDFSPGELFEGISATIICALVVGKFLGIFGASWLTVRMRMAPMPECTDWSMIASVAMLGGIGFTVSLFIADLSFGGMGADGVALLNHSKLGILTGSVLAGVIGYLLLHHFLPRQVDKKCKKDD